MVARRYPWPRLLNGSKNSWGFGHVKHDEMSSKTFEQRFQIARKKRGSQTLETTSEKAISSCVTWQNTPRFLEYIAALARGFSEPSRHFERGEGPGDEVVVLPFMGQNLWIATRRVLTFEMTSVRVTEVPFRAWSRKNQYDRKYSWRLRTVE